MFFVCVVLEWERGGVEKGWSEVRRGEMGRHLHICLEPEGL